jgi:hypothetical protein
MTTSCLRQTRTCQHVKVGADAKSNANNVVNVHVLAAAVIMTPTYLSIFSFLNGTMRPMEL